MQGGIYVFQLVDWFVGALSVIIIGFLECVVLAWVYGKSSALLVMLRHSGSGGKEFTRNSKSQ